MRKGFTTGTAAAAAARAHARFIIHQLNGDYVDVMLPDGGRLGVPVVCRSHGAMVTKDAGDDPDVTHGAAIWAGVELREDDTAIHIVGGEGVGLVTRPGLQIPVGQAAINPVPRAMIEANVRAEIGAARGAVVTIWVPDGKRLAGRTFNARLGIEGGISIIGTTGIVEPMSVQALVDTIRCEIDVQLAEGHPITLVPGKIGEKYLQALHPGTSAVLVSNAFAEALAYLRRRQVDKLTLAGHPGKLAKLAMGCYNTHSNASPQAQGFVAAMLGLTGAFNTVEEICQRYPAAFAPVAQRIAGRVQNDYGFSRVDVLLFDMAGMLLASYPTANSGDL
ncbi:MAG: cobalt-precorrin-5B (C(1))-methyltransferase CbiD [Desulfuromonadales bacterium]|nr:cobalt-precorrin-5B (C(1))-methyltransferase CbiD [Desulfuromonadales bacterium]